MRVAVARLRDGADWAGGAPGWLAWSRALQDSVAVRVQAIAASCRRGHADMERLYAREQEAAAWELDAHLRGALLPGALAHMQGYEGGDTPSVRGTPTQGAIGGGG